MINIAEEKKFIQEVDRKTREMELEKAKLEQNKAIVEDQLRQVKEKMNQMGCTPETVSSKIQEHSDKIVALKAKMQSILEPQHNEDMNF